VTVKAHVDQSRCRGYGICTGLAPTVLSFGEDGRAVAEDRDLSTAEIEAVRQAARMCPERAIVSGEG